MYLKKIKYGTSLNMYLMNYFSCELKLASQEKEPSELVSFQVKLRIIYYYV